MNDIDHILQLTGEYHNNCVSLIKQAFIRKMPNGKYKVVSHKGKSLGENYTLEEAKKRLKQIEFFKHKDHHSADDEQDEKVIDLTDIDDYSYSAILRKLRQKASKEQVLVFLKLFKNTFDKSVKNKLQKPEKIALQTALIKFNKLHKIKLNKKFLKNASLAELGDPVLVGKYLADIIRFTLNRISNENRPHSINSLKQKLYTMDENEIGNKNMPASSAIGQCITFVKHILFNHDPHYVRKVLNNIVSAL